MQPGTLATACAWCVVECSSGVISACLPTLGPLVQLATHRLGISSASHSNGTPAASHDLVTIGGSGRAGEAYDSRFERLDEASPYTTLGLRPAHGGRIRVSVSHPQSASHDEMGDEVPLKGIAKKTEVGWAEERYDRRY